VDAGGTNVTNNVEEPAGTLRFNCQDTVPGIGVVRSRWTVSQPDLATQDFLAITVRTEVQAFLGRPSRVEFTTWRSCATAGCPGIP
jgi:hypothetical protein